MRRIDLTGRKFHLLTVESYDHTEKGRAYWKCRCDCGKETLVSTANLTSGVVKSCGCLLHAPSPRQTHGESQSKLYRHWASMVYRCTVPTNKAYKWYGARGIRVCDAWMTYEGFREWVLQTRPEEEYTVERIDVNGDYCPENCIWIPRGEQARNRTSCVLIEHNGVRKPLFAWCAELGLDYKRVHNRMYKLGWGFEEAISTPVDTRKRNTRTS